MLGQALHPRGRIRADEPSAGCLFHDDLEVIKAAVDRRLQIE
jgi:hypothetical protein